MALAPAALTGLGAGAARAQEAPATPAAANPFGRKYPPRVYQTRRLAGTAPAIDGRLDDEAWKQGEWAGGYTQQIPTEGAAAVAADRAQDPLRRPARLLRHPRLRRPGEGAPLPRPPRRLRLGDIVGICFDSYNDKQTGFEFDLTAGGSKIDLILGNGETEWDTTWDAVWDGKVAHDEKGWTAEFRIPLNQLRYGPQDEQVWGMHAWRWIDRNQEEDQWQLIPRQNTGRMYQLGELHGIRGLPRSRHLELLPFALGRASSGPSVPEGGTDGSGAVGLDAKLGLTSNFTLDATVNPDFGQVEADPSVINLTAYETFYEEKRPFFLEGRKILTLRGRGRGPALLLAPHRRSRRPASPSLGPTRRRRASRRAPRSSARSRSRARPTAACRSAALQSLHPEGDGVGDVAPRRRARRVVEPFGSYTVGPPPQGLGQGQHEPRRHADVDASVDLGRAAAPFLPTQATTGGHRLHALLREPRRGCSRRAAS